jgi:membrane protease YdiL (CAAX protease family)
VRPTFLRIRYNSDLCTLVQTPPVSPPNHPSGRRAVGPRFVSFAGLFYGSLVVVAALWGALRGFPLDFFGTSVLQGMLLGALTAVATITSGLVAYRLLPQLRQLADELAPRLLDGADRASLLLVSLFSGVGEEALFRGAVQQEFGLVVASLLFGLAHVGPDRRYLLWTAWAVLAGFVFGALYEVTGGLLAPILAHAAHNAATLLLWKRSRKGGGGPAAPEPPESGSGVR